jgi:hypothetical protein
VRQWIRPGRAHQLNVELLQYLVRDTRWLVNDKRVKRIWLREGL